MKRFLPILSLAFVMVACTSQPQNNTDTAVVHPLQQSAPTVVTDTIGLAEFNDWKAQNELADRTVYQQRSELAAAPVKAVAPVRKAKKVQPAPAKRAVSRSTAPRSTPAANGGGTADNGEVVVANSESSDAAKAEEKKGWSKAAKGTAIGAGAGAAAGAIITKKNRVLGGVVGGVVGGAVGYGVGKVLDKKDGRK